LYGKLGYPGHVPKNHKAIPLIEQLLNKNPALRGDANSLKSNGLFNNFNWEGLLDKRLTPPYR